MTRPRHIAVIDIGKTNAKLALVDLDTLSEIAVRRTPNHVLADGPYPHFDTEALWSFILDGLADFVQQHPVDAISVTTHGVAAALIDSDGQLVLPVLDYEFDLPETAALAYDEARPPFSETGSPRLPVGLNLGAQLFWQQKTFPDDFARVTTILTYPQYWAWRLCGIAAAEVTSLGCHTDLWSPAKGDYSSIVDAMGWRKLFPPIRRAAETLSPLRAEIAARTGLPPTLPVTCGIHDSNASLLPHLMSRTAPFAVVSTGTWVISMAVGGAAPMLDPARDTLINVNALGNPVPSARFMGGREYSTLLGREPVEPTDADIARVLSAGILLLPLVEQGSGPYQHRKARWSPVKPDTPGERHATVSFYLAMMTATCLELIGADGDIVVEGPFAANGCFTGMLATATGRRVVTTSGSTGTSIGAALLAGGDGVSPAVSASATTVAPHSAWIAYAKRWRSLAG